MSECKHAKPILVSIEPGRFVPDDQPYEAGKYERVDIIYNYAIMLTGHYCAECETLLDVDVCG